MSLKQTRIEKRVDKCENDVVNLEDLTENLRIDADFIDGRTMRNANNLNELERALDALKRNVIRDRMRIFGLVIDPKNDLISKKKAVIDKVLKVANNKVDWHMDDIKHLQCYGKLSDENTPLTIVHFRFEDDKAHVYNGCTLLREQGIRVSDDLTVRQRKWLKELKECGQQGYIYRG